MFLSRDNHRMSRDKCFLSQTLLHGTATFIFTYKRECIFSVKGFFVSVQYRKTLHTCITLIYMAIYFSHTIRPFIRWRSISMRAGPAFLQFDWSKAGLSMDLPVFVYFHTKTGFKFFQYMEDIGSFLCA